MPRLSEVKRNELEAFWRAHLQGWSDSALNQREYCEAHGLPLKRFGNWRAKLRGEVPQSPGKLLWRRGGGDSTSVNTSTKDSPRATWVPTARLGESKKRRGFSLADKKRIVSEAAEENASVSGVAKKYGIASSVVFRWRKDLAPDPQPEPTFAEVKLSDMPLEGTAVPLMSSAPPLIVERPAPGIEIELKGGRRVRFDRETDPEVIRGVVALLEGADQ